MRKHVELLVWIRSICLCSVVDIGWIVFFRFREIQRGIKERIINRFLWVNLCTGYCDNNKVGVTFWKFAKTLVQNWETNLTRVKDTEMNVKMRVSCD